jgi:hypothetical protein
MNPIGMGGNAEAPVRNIIIFSAKFFADLLYLYFHISFC